MRDGCCPICNADVPMSGDERAGDEVYCSYCGMPLRFKKLSADEEPELYEED